MKKLISLVLLMMVIVVGCKQDEPIIPEYIVTFYTKGGSNIEAIKVSEGLKITKPEDPTREDYIFSGWYKDAEHTAVWDFEKDRVMYNLTLYVKWIEIARICTVTFNSQGGSEVASKAVNKGEKLVRPTDPTMEKRSFLGWYKDAACTIEWNFNKDVVNGDITLYARWSEVGETVYTVTFDTDGGNEIDPVSVKADEKVSEPTTPVKSGYKFGGWYSDAGKQNKYDFNTPVTENITLYAHWSEAVYIVTFNTDGGNKIAPVPVKADEKVAEPATPVKPDCKFGGWYSDAGKQNKYDFSTPVTKNITLYAKWEKAEFALVDFDDTGLEAQGVKWDAGTKTLDITNAKGDATFSFNVEGASGVDKNVTPKYDRLAKSIGGVSKLDGIVNVGAVVGGKIGMKIKTPVQNNPKVPLDIEVVIADAGDPNAKDVITIKSRPDYDGTNIQPVMMKTKDNKLVFWAPVNVGATEIPTIVPQADSEPGGTNVITKSCGQLFQWGRKYGFENTNNKTDTDAEKFKGEAPLGYPKGGKDVANMSPWDGKFILESYSSPNTRGNWFLFNTDGSDNTYDAEVSVGEWYQQLWNEGTEESPVKTDYDPCPAGWRVPTLTEWKAIGADYSVTHDWDSTNHLLTIAGAESDQKLILPAVGKRKYDSGDSSDQGRCGYYWSSSVWFDRGGKVGFASFSTARLSVGELSRAHGHSVRCIQE